MYLSNNQPILVNESTRKHRTEIVDRLYGMGFNLIPMNGKKPCIRWKPYQTQRVTPEETKEWMSGRFPTKDGRQTWKARNHNFALLTGSVPWSDNNPGVVVLDADDEQAEAILPQYCPETPMIQRTGGGGSHWVYRRPEVERISNRQKTVIGGESFNLDVRGDGGYIVAPGSIHPRTRQMYEEMTPWTLELLMQCPVYDPTWLPCERATTKKTSISVPAEISGEHDHLVAEVNTAVEERETQARRYLDSVPGTQEGTGADRKCSALTMNLLWGFALPDKVVLNMLAEWGQKSDQLDVAGGWYPWTEQELVRKIEWCFGQEYHGNLGDRIAPVRELSSMEAKVDEVVTPIDDAHTIDPKNHLEIAETFLRDCFIKDKQPTLIHHQATWHQWSGTRYEAVIENDIKARLWKWLATCRCWIKEKRETFRPKSNVVSGVMDALKAIANKSSHLESPCWLTDGPSEVIAFDNGLLNVESFLSGEINLLRHTPDWFSPNCLPHMFDTSSTCPKWLSFLDEVFDQDEERIV